MSNNYQEHLAENAAAESRTALDKANAEGYAQILARYAIRDTQANYAVLRDWAAPNAITVDSFIALLRSDPKAIDMSSREGVIQDIVDVSTGSDNDLRSLKFRLSTFSLAQLRQKMRDISFKKQVSTHAEAKKYLAEGRKPETTQFPGWPALPQKMYERGKGWIEVDAAYLEHLIREDVFSFKRLVKLYGGQQVDRRRGL
jgi:hypothetical protein